ncbi:MAG: AraC family transcriptional regulator [Clostridia bacterium]|nr:AraC family transcriptional regulator [Clostridia bacterium]
MIELSDECINGYAIVREMRKTPVSMANRHYHEHFEIYYLTQGKVRYFIENMTFDLKAGDMILIAPQVIHRTASTENKALERVLLSFRCDFLGKKINNPIFDCFKRYYIPDAAALAPLIHTIENEAGLNDKFSSEMIRCCIKKLLIQISRTEKTDTKCAENSSAFQEISKFITDNYSSELTLDLLSKRFAISKSHLSRQFKNATGFNLSKYITIVRIKNAQRLLLTTEYPITEVATMCGFNNSSYFAAVFKRIIGISPLKLRKNSLLLQNRA